MRTMDEVNREYSQLCLQLGDLQHKLKVMGPSVAKLEERLMELDAEADEIRKEEAKPKAVPDEVA